MLKDFMEGIDSEEWNKYNGRYDEIRKKSKIVDGINVESFDFSKKKNELNSQVQQKQLEEEVDVTDNEYFYEEREQLEEDNITTIEETEQYKHSLEEVRNLEGKSKSESYLDEISQLLTELNELDIMLKQTSIEIKGEKSKKQKNKELKAKMKKVEDLIHK